MRACVTLLILIVAVSAWVPVQAQELSLFGAPAAKTDTGMDVGSFAISLADGSRIYGVAGDRLVVSRDGGAAWSALTTPEYVVEIGALSVSDNNADRIWMARSNLIWRSDNGGVSWRQLSSPSVWSISKIVTTEDGGLFIATTGNGVFFSDSGGDFWQTRSRGLPPGAGAAPIIEIEDLLISPTESNTLFVVAAFLGVFKSEDGGRNWEPRNRGLPVPFLLPTLEKGMIAVGPLTPGILHLSLTVPIHSHKSERSIFTSSNGGDSWQLVSTEEIN